MIIFKIVIFVIGCYCYCNQSLFSW